ncbi:PRD domain-containing protein [Acidaminobacter sp. JC074]|uniref:BglG family transcription antiterminator n=1 Tax=Acidaminobacter sp. JC074 TaxID=2530199 RepID=UPI001F0DB1F2|nr:PRD domain-containing protein [Acidaminobacter sp. JC074]MCH4888766.1 PRD domain-containing protein [Acidaminobacter sp. JC074]
MKPNYTIITVMNNNVVLAKNHKTKNEVVLLGKGIGFGKKKDTSVFFSEDIIERSFININKSVKKEYYELIQQMDLEIMGLCQEIILMAEKEIGDLNDNIHIVLTDHIGFAIERLRQDIEIANPFLHEIKILYSDEFKIGMKAIELINEHIDVQLPEEEAAFIALHLHSARKNKAVKKTLKNTKVIKEIVALLENEIGKDISEDVLTYRRLLTHIRASIDRIENGISLENPLLDTIKTEFKDSWSIASKAKEVIENKLDLKVPDDEQGYLTIHIDRLMRLKKQRVTD